MYSDKDILLLIPLNDDSTDSNGVLYPEIGKVQSEDFENDKTASNGLIGIKDAKFLDDKWVEFAQLFCILRCPSDNAICIDEENNLYKVKSGFVLFCGNFKDSVDFIQNNSIAVVNHYTESEGYIRPANTVVDSVNTDPVIAVGFGNSAISQSKNSHAIAIGDKSHAYTYAPSGHAIAHGEQSKAVSIEDTSLSLTIGNKSRSRTCGNESISMSSNKDSQVIATGCNSMAIGLGDNNVGCSGQNGILVLSYYDATRKRLKVGYVGEDIKANCLYKIEDGLFVEIEG